MAKPINDRSADNENEVTPASGSEIRSMLNRYENLQEEKKGISDSQKNILSEFDATHGLPPWIAKIVRKFDQIDDEGTRGHAWNALVRAGKALGFDQQPDMLDEAA